MSDAREEKKALDKYLKQTQFWESDKIKSEKRSRLVAWILAIVGLSIGGIATWTVGQLAPLKETIPYVVRVNTITGAVDIIKSLKNGETNYDEAINKFFLGWYLRYREGYSRSLATYHYDNVGLMSGEREKARFFAFFKPSNPKSPLNVYDDNERILIKIKSVSFINEDKDLALVRYIRTHERAGVDKPDVTHWAATVKFIYTSAPLSEEERSINPLGFQAMEYRTDPDSGGTKKPASITYKESARKKPRSLTPAIPREDDIK